METIFCLIRHGQTDWNKNRIIQGRMNHPLNDIGRAQAMHTGNILKEHDPNWDLIISSPLDRAQETARIIAGIIGYKKDIIIDNDIIEREFGEADQQKITDEIYAKIFKNDIRGIEKSWDLEKRAIGAINKLEEKYPGKKILLVTHSHFIKGLFVQLSPNFSYRTVFNNAGLNYVYLDNGKITKFIANKEY